MDFKIFASILLLSIIISCNKDKKAVRQIDKNIIEGTWRITNFRDSGDDETYHFMNYNFSFSDN